MGQAKSTDKSESSLEQKGGIVLYGKGADGKLYVVAPYTVGRFSESGKIYSLGKGTVDSGETVWQGAKREFREETGIDIDRLLKSQDDGAYAGVKVKTKVEEHFGTKRTELKDTQEPDWKVVSKVRSGRDSKKEQTLYVIEVDEGIEKLEAYCKGKGEERDPRLIAQTITKSGLLGFTDLLAEMRGVSRLSKQNVNKTLRKKMAANVVQEAEVRGEGLSALEDWYFQARAQNFGEPLPAKEQRHFHTEAEFDQFFRRAPQTIRNKVKDWASVVKNRLEKQKSHGEYVGDDKPLKLDAKGRPLRYYREGAEILPFAQYLQRMHSDIAASQHADSDILYDYAEMMGAKEVVVGGNREDAKASRETVDSQISILTEIYKEATEKAELKPATRLLSDTAEAPLRMSEMPLVATR